MPTANPSNIVWVVEQVRKINPKRILDVGVGFGKWGYLCRDYLEATRMRMTPKEWKVVIDGVEPCERYINSLQELIYNKIYNKTIEEYLPEAFGYDLIIANDVIEHMDKKVAWCVLNTLIKQNTWVIVTVPLDDQLVENDDIVSDYPYERHRSIWLLEDFKNHPYLKKQKKVSSKHPSGKMILVFHNLKGTS